MESAQKGSAYWAGGQVVIQGHWHPCHTLVVWYKQWKVRSGCLDKFALGNSRESSDFLEGRSPEGKSDDPREKSDDPREKSAVVVWKNLP